MGDLLNQRSLQSFVEETQFLEKLAELRKQALLAGVGKVVGRVARPAAWVGGHLGALGKGVKELPQAAQETMELAAHPLRSLKKGWGEQSWMGQKGIWSKLPVGQKSLGLAFAAPGVYDAYQATKEAPTPTGEGGAAEKLLGEVGGTGGFFTGMASKRMLPGLALMMGGQYLGGRMGRVIDRLRGGANLRTALSAPSPTEAASQLEDLQRYYG